MLRRTMFAGVMGLMLLGASVGPAQEQKSAQGRGGFGGFGGGPGGGFPVSNSMLLGIPEVQKELGINDDQKGLIQDMQADMMEQSRSLFGNFNFQEFQSLDREERQKRMEEGRKKGEELTKKADEMVATILEPKQSERLTQLRLQREGVGSFASAEVAEKIGMSQEQRKKVGQILVSMQPDPNQSSGLFRRDMSEEERREAGAKWRELREKMREKSEKGRADILGVLTSEQKERWEKMQGAKFEFPRRQFGGSGGGRPGGNAPRPKNESKKDDRK